MHQFKISLNKMYKIYPLAALLFSVFSAFGQHGSIKGTVTTQDGQPAAYVNIVLKEKSYGVTTGDDGAYIINNIKPGNYILVTSFIGLQTYEQPVTVNSGETTVVNITLSESAHELEEVMITDTRGLNEFLPAIGKGKLKRWTFHKA